MSLWAPPTMSLYVCVILLTNHQQICVLTCVQPTSSLIPYSADHSPTLWRHRWQEASEFLCTKTPLFGEIWATKNIAKKTRKCSLRRATNVGFFKISRLTPQKWVTMLMEMGQLEGGSEVCVGVRIYTNTHTLQLHVTIEKIQTKPPISLSDKNDPPRQQQRPCITSWSSLPLSPNTNEQTAHTHILRRLCSQVYTLVWTESFVSLHTCLCTRAQDKCEVKIAFIIAQKEIM